MRVWGEDGITSGGTSSQGAVGEGEYGMSRGKRRAGAMEGRGLQSLGEGGGGGGD